MVIIYMSCSQDIKLLLDDIGVLKPTVLVAVPRVLDRIYNGMVYLYGLNDYNVYVLHILFHRLCHMFHL